MTVFHFTPLVMTAALVALPFIWLVMPRLLPDNSPETGHEPRRFHALLRCGANAAGRRRSIGELKAMLPGEVEFRASEDERLADGGRVEVFATHEALEEAMRLMSATAAPAWLMERLKAGYGRTGEDLVVMELAIAGEFRA